MGKYGKITEALAAAGRRMEALEAKMAEARAKYEEALTLQAEKEEAANDMRRELLGRHAWRYCRAGQLIPQLDKLIRSGESDIDEQRALFGLAPLTEKEKSEAAKEEAALEATLISALSAEPHPAVEAKRRRESANAEGETSKKRGRKRKDNPPQEETPADAVSPEAPQEPVPELPADEAPSEMESSASLEPEPMELEETCEERFGVFDAPGEEEHLDDAPTPEVITGLEEPPAETEQTEDALPVMDLDVVPEFLPIAPAENATEDPLLF